MSLVQKMETAGSGGGGQAKPDPASASGPHAGKRRARFRWIAAAVAGLMLAAVATLYFLDWNQFRGPIGRYLSARTGREIRIDGSLHVDLFRLEPHVAVSGLYIGNPGWVGRAQGARIDRGEFSFRLFPALFSHWIVPLIRIDGADLLLVRDGSGRTNWDGGTGSSLPPIRRFILADGHVEIDDAVRGLVFKGTVSSREQAGGGGAFLLKGDGTLNGGTFTADLKGGPLLNVDLSKPYAFHAQVQAGQTHAVIDGAILHPFDLTQWNAQAQFSGANLGDLYLLTGLALPGTPPYRLGGTLRRNGDFYSFTEVNGVVGRSDLHGWLSVDASGRLPDLRGRLASRRLDFDDLGALFRGGKPAGETPGLLPDIPLHTAKLRQLTGEVDYDADAIASRDFPLRGLSTHISVRNAVLTLKPLAFSFTEGKLSGALSIDGGGDTPVTSVDARVSDIHVEHFIQGQDKPVSGLIEARAKLSGKGNSVHKAAASANGQMTLVMPSGRIRRTVAAWLGVNVLDALGLSLSGDKSQTGVRCAVADFGVKDGRMQARQFVLDTDPVRVDAGGWVDLKDETLDVKLEGKPKSFQLLRAKVPITVSGKLQSPSLAIDPKPVVTQGAIGVGLSLLSPLAAILAFIDPGLADDANCAAMLSDAKAKGAPVKASAVDKAASKPPN
jgi:uncharacterized protein involved in outer membrane biogenesis